VVCAKLDLPGPRHCGLFLRFCIPCSYFICFGFSTVTYHPCKIDERYCFCRHVFWFYLIVKMAIRVLFGKYDDVRSGEDEDEKPAKAKTN